MKNLLPNLPGIVYVLIFAVPLGFGWLKAHDAKVIAEARAEAKADSLNRERNRISALMEARDEAEQDFLSRIDSLNHLMQENARKLERAKSNLRSSELALREHLADDTLGQRLVDDISEQCRSSILALNNQLKACEEKDVIHQQRIAGRDSTISDLQRLTEGLNKELQDAIQGPGFFAELMDDLPKYAIAFVAGVIAWEIAR